MDSATADKLEKQIRRKLKEIAYDTYLGHEIADFSVNFIHRDYKSKLGFYQSSGCRIYVAHTDRPILLLIKTAIHELAHHIDYVVNKKHGHSISFYETYRKLLISAIQLGYFTLNEINNGVQRDLSILVKKTGRFYQKEIITGKDIQQSHVFVKGSATHERRLKNFGFRLDPKQNIWFLRCRTEAAGSFLKKVCSTLTGIHTYPPKSAEPLRAIYDNDDPTDLSKKHASDYKPVLSEPVRITNHRIQVLKEAPSEYRIRTRGDSVPRYFSCSFILNGHANIITVVVAVDKFNSRMRKVTTHSLKIKVTNWGPLEFTANGDLLRFNEQRKAFNTVWGYIKEHREFKALIIK